MHIIYIFDYGHVNGGAAQVVIAEALEMAARGHRVTYFCCVGPVDERLTQACSNVVCLNQPDILAEPKKLLAARRGIWNFRAAAELGQVLRSSMGDEEVIVHVHGWTKALSVSVFNVLENMNTPYVVTLHDYFSACPNGGFYNYQERSICALKAMGSKCLTTNCDSRNYGHKIYRIIRQAVGSTITTANGKFSNVIYISKFSRTILDPYFTKDAKWYFVPNPISALALPPVNVKANTTILFVGRIAAEKGVELFCKAVAKVGVLGTAVGDGVLLAQLRADWPKIKFPGWQDQATIAGWMNGARALVFPSECYETYGLVVAEAMALGLPVIVADGTAAAEMVDDGVNGILFRRGDYISLAAAIAKLGDAEYADSIGHNAYRAYWSQPSTIQAHCLRLESVYDAVLSETR